MVALMRVLAVDLGSSNTAAMVRTPDGRHRALLFDGAPLMPSAVYRTPEGRLLVGRDAERHARVDPGRFEPSPKRRVDDGEVLLGDAEVPVARLFGAVLEQVSAEAHRVLGGPPHEVRLTHPARWGPRRRGVLLAAAGIAGLPEPMLVPEPVAAASYFTAVLGATVPVGRCLAIYDLGGGTFDATVVRRTPNGFDVLAEDGLGDVGGLDFDQAIVAHLGRTVGAASPQWTSLLAPVDTAGRRARRTLYDDVRAAKEMLSRTAGADIPLPVLDVEAHLTRPEFEALVRPYLHRTVACLSRTLAGAGLAAAELAGIFLVGGSSRIPLAAHLIHTELGVAPTTLEQPETVVVQGTLTILPPAAPPVVSSPPVSAPPPVVSSPPVSAPPPVVSTPPVSPAPVSPSYPLSPVAPLSPVVPAALGYPARRADPVRAATFAVLALVLLAIAVLTGLLLS
jgi:molecular chaperone DnaK